MKSIREFLRALRGDYALGEKIAVTADYNMSRFDDDRMRELEDVEARLRRVQEDHRSLINRRQVKEGS